MQMSATDKIVSSDMSNGNVVVEGDERVEDDATVEEVLVWEDSEECS